MARSKNESQLYVDSLLAHGSLSGTTPLYLTGARALIESVVLVSQLEDIQRVRPNTVVVLSAEMGAGGWLASAALRHAWERRASAVIVAGSTYASGVVVLAERLDITLLATHGDPAGLALALSAEIGAALSVVDAKLARVAQAVAKETSVGEVVKTVSRELDGIGISLEYGDIVVASAGTSQRTAVDVISVEVGTASSSSFNFALMAHMPSSGRSNPLMVRSILEVAVPAVKAALLFEDLVSADRAVPTAAFGFLAQDFVASGAELLETQGRLLAELGWRLDEPYVAVFFSSRRAEGCGPELTAVLRLLWRKVAVRSPLAEVQDGWLAIVPAGRLEVGDQLENRIEVRLGAALFALNLTAGLSRWREEPTSLPLIVHEARLAAAAASPGKVLGFARLGVSAAATFVDAKAIALVAELTLPRLMACDERDVIIAAVAAFLDHHGSVSLAAKSLNVHRNTLQARLHRARELGVPLDMPSELLSVHLILNVLRRSWQDLPGSQSLLEKEESM
ncbi:helix-turn-helix domain-containing protein (plasmid) [Paenarthrobacter sp. YJN-5]|nr:helix-turn-helix domain-containing protein [Paenarthrobacter sp. YJN-5]